MLSELHLCLRVNLNRYSPAGIFSSFLLLNSPLLIRCCFTLKFPARQGYSFGVSAVVEATVPQPMPSHTAALVPLCLHLLVYTPLLQKTSLQTFSSSLSHRIHKGPVSLFPSQDTGMYQSLVTPSSKLRTAELRRVSAEEHGLN